MPHYPVRRPLAGLVLTREERALVKHVATAQRLAVAARAEDAARREIVAGRISDTAILTHHAIDEGIGIAARVEAEAAARPFAAGVAARLGDTGVQQIDHHLRSYAR